MASLNGTEGHFPGIVELIKPRGHIALIDDPQNLDINSIKPKALSFSWEFIDDGSLISTVGGSLGQLSLETLKDAHVQQESGRVIGKNVLEGF